jgi:hypothetical protein
VFACVCVCVCHVATTTWVVSARMMVELLVATDVILVRCKEERERGNRIVLVFIAWATIIQLAFF